MMRHIGTMEAYQGGVITMARGSRFDEVKPGCILRLSPRIDGEPRPGSLKVLRASPERREIYSTSTVAWAVITAAVGDRVFVELEVDDSLNESSSIDDHACLVAHLLSAVRRKDWHAVSDAANDLRVLEARHGR